MVAVAALLPIVLLVIGLSNDRTPQGSMSAYYHSSTLTKDIFVGALWAVGVFLILYQGFSQWENILLNVAGTAAILVALFPMDWECGTNGTGCRAFNPHRFFAVLFFFSIASVCWFRAEDTLYLIRDDILRRNYRRIYKTIGLAMAAAPITVFVLAVVLRLRETQSPWVFIIEAIGIWIFAAYWVTKSREIARTDAEERALNLEVEMTDDGLRPSSSHPGGPYNLT